MWAPRLAMLVLLASLLAPAISGASMVSSGAMDSRGLPVVPQLRCVFHLETRDTFVCVQRGPLREATEVQVVLTQAAEVSFLLDEIRDPTINLRRQIAAKTCTAGCAAVWDQPETVPDAELWVRVRNMAFAPANEVVVSVDERASLG